MTDKEYSPAEIDTIFRLLVNGGVRCPDCEAPPTPGAQAHFPWCNYQRQWVAHTKAQLGYEDNPGEWVVVEVGRTGWVEGVYGPYDYDKAKAIASFTGDAFEGRRGVVMRLTLYSPGD